MTNKTTVEEAIQSATKELIKGGIDTAILDASVLMCHVLDKDKLYIFTHNDKKLTPSELKSFTAFIERRLSHEPVAYITGKKEFWGLTFKTHPNVLIPRPDTETLIATMLTILPDNNASAKIAELGVGSGAIITSILSEFPNLVGFATDTNPDAIKLTQENAHNIDKENNFNISDRLTLLEGSWTTPFGKLSEEEKFNIIVSNPPYISSQEMKTLDRDVKDFEPHSALEAGNDGLKDYRELIPLAYANLVVGGILLLEIGHEQSTDVTKIMQKHNWLEIKTFQDLASQDRIIVGIKHTSVI